MTLWVLWKKAIKRLIKLDHNDTSDNIYHEKFDMPFNSLMTEFFDASNISEQTENSKFPESGFTLDKIMHLYMR